ncbi:MAG: molybdopterin-guanine dinucleotide biosynthesis protein B [Proteobacteria bacterium]|nr:molybdopterin-guanine dinucleotide biosynthesis protein B [Pseudomonadota bacterium]
MPKVLSFVGTSDSGKTTLVSKLISELRNRGIRVAVIKHAHDGFELDRKGSDSFTYQEAGAHGVMLASPQGIALMKSSPTDVDLDELITFFPDVDLVITEGFKKENKPKIEVYRAGRDEPPLGSRLENLIATVTDAPIHTDQPVFPTQDILALADFVVKTFLS